MGTTVAASVCIICIICIDVMTMKITLELQFEIHPHLHDFNMLMLLRVFPFSSLLLPPKFSVSWQAWMPYIR